MCGLRAGSDIAFLGGMINYILEQRAHISRSTCVEQHQRPLWWSASGSGSATACSRASTPTEKPRTTRKAWAFELDAKGVPVRDATLHASRVACLQPAARSHYERYTHRRGGQGHRARRPRKTWLRVYEGLRRPPAAPDKAGHHHVRYGLDPEKRAVCRTSAPCPSSSSCSATSAWPGGGVNALRGESNVQGSTDHGAPCGHLARLPGPCPLPAPMTTLADYNATTPKTNDPKSVNWWGNRPKYTASFLMSLYPGVTPDVAYSCVPRLDADKPSGPTTCGCPSLTAWSKASSTACSPGA